MKPSWLNDNNLTDGRPFTGAWIETCRRFVAAWIAAVAPSRGRGLKRQNCLMSP